MFCTSSKWDFVIFPKNRFLSKTQSRKSYEYRMKFGGRGGRVKKNWFSVYSKLTGRQQRMAHTDRQTDRQTDCLMPQSLLPFTHMRTEILNSTMTRAGDPLVLVTRKEPVFAFCPLKELPNISTGFYTCWAWCVSLVVRRPGWDGYEGRGRKRVTRR